MQQAFSHPNPNAFWMNGRGMWAAYIFSVAFLHVLLNCIPIISVPIVWTLTHIIHNVVSVCVDDTIKVISLVGELHYVPLRERYTVQDNGSGRK